MEATIYNTKGKESGTIALPEALFGLKWNADLVHQVVTSMQGNARSGTADTKGRGEVRGGGRKPWKQKGTGQARHGSTRSPIWKGGGTTHGPLAEKNYNRKINKKMKVKALFTVLSKKMKDGKILFVESFDMPQMKTKNAALVAKSLASIKGFEKLAGKKSAGLLALPAKNESIARSFNNLSQFSYMVLSDLNPVDVMTYKYLIIVDPKSALATLEKKLSAK